MQVEDLVLRLRSVVDAGVDQIPGKLDDIARLGMAAAAGLAAAAAALAAMTVDAAHAADKIAKSARALSLSVEAYQALALAADLAGVSVEALTPAVATLSRQLGAAQNGSKEASRALAAVGLSAEDASRPMEDVFGDLLDGLAAMPEGAQRSAVAMQLLGEQGLRMATLIEGGSAAIKAAREELEKSGALISPESAKRAEAFVDDLTLLQTRVSGLGTALGLRLLPVGERVLDWLDALVEAGAPVALASMESISRVLGAAMDGLATPLGKVVGLLGGAGLAVGLVRMAGGLLTMATSLPVVGPLLSGLGASIAAIGAGPIAAVIAGIVGLYLAIDDLIVYMQGGDSVFGDFVDWLMSMEQVREIAGLVADLGSAMASLGSTLGGSVMASALDWLRRASEYAAPLLSLAGSALDSIGSLGSAVASGAGDVVATTLRGAVGMTQRAAFAAAGSQVSMPVSITVQGVTGEQVAHQTAAAIRREAAITASQAGR